MGGRLVRYEYRRVYVRSMVVDGPVRLTDCVKYPRTHNVGVVTDYLNQLGAEGWRVTYFSPEAEPWPYGTHLLVRETP